MKIIVTIFGWKEDFSFNLFEPSQDDWETFEQYYFDLYSLNIVINEM